MNPAQPNDRRPWWWASALIALTVYPPLLLHGRGSVAANTDAGLLVDPERAIGRSLSIWDPHIGMGTVPLSGVSTLWPLGPWFWAAERIGLPDWAAQRLLLGTAITAAGTGVLFLARTWRWRPTAGIAAAFAYALSPFVLTPAVASIGLLLPYAGLPWLLALTVRALRTDGWRHPAVFALVTLTIGPVDPTSLLLLSVAPAAWVLYAYLTTTELTPGHALTATAKIVVLTLSVNLWWIVSAVVRAGSEVNGRLVGANPQTASAASSATEVLRGLGNWRSYARDPAGPIIDVVSPYTQNLPLLGLTLALPTLGVIGLGVARWRHRPFLVLVLAGATIVAVGAHPWADPSPLGAVVEAFVRNDIRFPFGDLSRAVPLIVLTTSLGIGALVGAMSQQSARRGVYACALVAISAIAALPPLWAGDLVSHDRSRPEDLPAHWREAASELDRRDDGTRVLEIPGADSASYRWGDSAGPVTPVLIDRPHVARELAPQSSAAAADLVAAFDQRLQDRMLDADGLPVVARLLAAGDLVTRNDLRTERYGLIGPSAIWDLATGADDLGDPVTYTGDAATSGANAGPIDEARILADGVAPPPVAIFPVLDPVPIVRALDPTRAIILSGNGAGLVDAASAGLIDGSELLRYSADLTSDPDFLRETLVDDRSLIVTDTNRERGRRWDAVRGSDGYTEQELGGLLRPDLDDRRLPLFDDAPGTTSVAVHEGVEVRATSYGARERYEPEFRPFRAVDGDPTTAWRVDGGDDPSGERIELTVPEGVSPDGITIVQAPGSDTGPRIVSVDLRFDGGAPQRVRLDARSFTAPGQVVPVEEQDFEQLSVEITEATGQDTDDTVRAAGVGFAEIDVGVAAREFVRMPDDLLAAGGFRTSRYPLALVQTRERSPVTDVDRADEEFAIARIVDLPTARSYRLGGSVRLSGQATSTLVDELLGRDPTVRVTATSTIPGGLRHEPRNVLDGDPDTRWTSAFDPVSPALTIDSPEQTVSRIEVTAVDDELHSLPRSATVIVPDGGAVGRGVFQPDAGGTTRAVIELDETVRTSQITIALEDVERRPATDERRGGRVLPVAVTSIDAGVARVSPTPATIDSGCRNDLVLLDGIGTPVRITGSTAAALDGQTLALESCDGIPVAVPGGEHHIEAAPGLLTGFDIDQLVWCSSADGDACEPGLLAPRGDGQPDDVPSVAVVGSDGAEVQIEVSGASAGEPLWVVLGQSHDPRWEIIGEDLESEEVALVNGASNGFLVTAPAEEFSLTMRYRPQNQVEIGLLLSVVGVVVTLGLALSPAGSSGPVPIPLQEPIRRIRALTWEGALPTRRTARFVGVVSAIGAGIAVGPIIGALIGIVAGFATRREGWRPLFTVAPAAILAIGAVFAVTVQARERVPLGPSWPTETDAFHPAAMAAVVLASIDVLIQHLWLRRSDFR